MSESDDIVIEIVGEGKADIGPVSPDPKPTRPVSGILPILLHKLCGNPESMRVRCHKEAHLQKGGRERKVEFAKGRAFRNQSAALVYVVDTEGSHPKAIEELKRGRDGKFPDFPTVVGVAHTCIEAWLLADERAIQRGLKVARLSQAPPKDPESLPAPRQNREKNPKTVLAECCSVLRNVSGSEMDEIAKYLRPSQLKQSCPQSFSPFAVEVEERLLPLFQA